MATRNKKRQGESSVINESLEIAALWHVAMNISQCVLVTLHTQRHENGSSKIFTKTCLVVKMITIMQKNMAPVFHAGEFITERIK